MRQYISQVPCEFFHEATLSACTHLSSVTSALPCSSLITIKADNVVTVGTLGMFGFFSVSHIVFSVAGFFIVREHWIYNVAFITPFNNFQNF